MGINKSNILLIYKTNLTKWGTVHIKTFKTNLRVAIINK